jgi:hypothetical protein
MCIDMFICGTTYTDLATTSCLANLTGGQVRVLPGFVKVESAADSSSSEEDRQSLQNDAAASLQSQVCVR